MAIEIEHELARYFAWIEEQTGLELHREERPDEFGIDSPRSDHQIDQRHPRRRWMLVAAATIVVLALGMLAVAAVQEPDSVQTDTVPDTPAPSTNPATTSTLLPDDSTPATLPASTIQTV